MTTTKDSYRDSAYTLEHAKEEIVALRERVEDVAKMSPRDKLRGEYRRSIVTWLGLAILSPAAMGAAWDGLHGGVCVGVMVAAGLFGVTSGARAFCILDDMPKGSTR